MVRTYHRVELSGVASAAPHHFFDEKDLTKMVGEKVAKKGRSPLFFLRLLTVCCIIFPRE